MINQIASRIRAPSHSSFSRPLVNGLLYAQIASQFSMVHKIGDTVGTEKLGKNLTEKSTDLSEPSMPGYYAAPITRWQKIKMLLVPDTGELIIFMSALLLSIILIGSFHVDDIWFMLIFCGLVSLSFFGYRWGYSSVFDTQVQKLNKLRAHKDGKLVIVNFRLSGILVSAFMVVLGFIFV
jgi:hypothetical protein